MRLVTCKFEGRQYLGVELDENIFFPVRHSEWDQSIDSMLALIDAGTPALEQLKTISHNPDEEVLVAKDKVMMCAPIPRPRQNVICLGLNYKDHVSETLAAKNEEVKLPRSPVVFTKAANTINGPFSDIDIDTNISSKMDWEVELAVIIGKSGMGINEEDAFGYVFGYTVLNDVTARDRQKWHKQFYIGKSYKGCCPIGPVIVTADEIPDPHALDLRCWVNGTIKQESNTKHQIFSIPHVISVLTQGNEIEAGDIIATGTPSGVGFARTPPEYLLPGDVVECEVEKIGRISNKIIQR
ncbi:MAG: fumarylacetoacetate hydrolase family protein [Pseudomonadota bacterium]